MISKRLQELINELREELDNIESILDSEEYGAGHLVVRPIDQLIADVKNLQDETYNHLEAKYD